MKYLIIVFISLIFIYSCDKDSNETIDKTSNSKFILIAGEAVHDSINYIEFNPMINIKGYRHGTDSDYYYSDSLSIDLDFDSINDIYFKYYQEFKQPNCDCEGIDCCMPWGYAFCVLKTFTNLEILSYEYIGYQCLKRLNFGDTIDSKLAWGKTNNEIIISELGMHNDWYLDYYNSFMGFRFIDNNDTIYDWIRMNTSYVDQIEIYDYAIEK